MRLWSLHPMYLDGRGLVAVWREALLAQAVLRDRTRGYRHHPQVLRFRACPQPLGAIGAYLRAVRAEARNRGYRFTPQGISHAPCSEPIPVTRGQIEYEWSRLMAKLAVRDPARHAQLAAVRRPRAHPLFKIVPGAIEPWEGPERRRRPIASRAGAERRVPRFSERPAKQLLNERP